MRLTPASTIFALSSFALFTHALPLSPQRPGERQTNRKRAVQYSVVAVDGGSSAAAATKTEIRTVTQSSEITTTVTAAPTTLPPATEIVVSTVVISEPEAPQTVTIATTQDTGSTVAQRPSGVDSAQPGGSSSSVAYSASTATATVPSSEVTTTTISTTTAAAASDTFLSISSLAISAQAQPTASPSYDNGLYHTSYPSWNASSSASITSLGSLPTLPSRTEDPVLREIPTPLGGTLIQLLPYNTTASSTTSATTSSPSMPKLPSATAGIAPSTGIHSIIVAEEHEVPGINRRLPSPTGSLGSWNGSGVYMRARALAGAPVAVPARSWEETTR